MRIRIKKLENEMISITRDQFVNAYMNLFNDKGNIKLLTMTGKPFHEPTVRNWVKKKHENIDFFAAIDERDVIVGIMILRRNTIEGIEIQNLVVDSQYRKKGIGRQFITVALENAKQAKFNSLDVSISADNVNMMVLALKNGFKPIEINYHKRFDNEDYLLLRNTFN